jgi:hypothetical protein
MKIFSILLIALWLKNLLKWSECVYTQCQLFMEDFKLRFSEILLMRIQTARFKDNPKDYSHISQEVYKHECSPYQNLTFKDYINCEVESQTCIFF